MTTETGTAGAPGNRPASTSATASSAGGPPSLSTTAQLTTAIHLYWLKYVWMLALVVLAVILIVASVRDATLDDSVWDQIGVGVLRWVIFAAGVTTLSSFAPMFLGNGVTRGQLASSSIVSMAVVSAIGAAVVALGYVIERIVYPRAGWELILRDAETPLDAGTIASRSISMAVLFAAYFVSGWLIGAAFYRYGSNVGLLLIVPSAIPLLVVDLLLAGPTNMIGGIDAIQRRLGPVDDVALPVALPLSAVIVVVACVAARRATQAVPLRA